MKFLNAFRAIIPSQALSLTVDGASVTVDPDALLWAPFLSDLRPTAEAVDFTNKEPDSQAMNLTFKNECLATLVIVLNRVKSTRPLIREMSEFAALWGFNKEADAKKDIIMDGVNKNADADFNFAQKMSAHLFDRVVHDSMRLAPFRRPPK